jgi:long-chain acyl-CoA synthetase
VPIYEGYGLTETTVSVCCNRPGAKRAGSVGKPYPQVKLRIADDSGGDVPVGEPGEILVKGPNIMQGYLNRPEATAEVLQDGWLHTGDVGYVDADGFVFIVDRKKDMIIKGGYNIYPREIEEVLYQMPAVAEAAVVGVEDEAKGESVRAVISVRPGENLEAEEVEKFLSANLAKYKLPSEYVFMTELPKGPTGKILKRELRT